MLALNLVTKAGRFALHYFFISRLIRLTTRCRLKNSDAEINPSNADDNGQRN